MSLPGFFVELQLRMRVVFLRRLPFIFLKLQFIRQGRRTLFKLFLVPFAATFFAQADLVDTEAEVFKSGYAPSKLLVITPLSVHRSHLLFLVLGIPLALFRQLLARQSITCTASSADSPDLRRE